MKHFVLTIILVFISCISLISEGASINASDNIAGTVVYDGKSDYHIVSTSRFYVIIEWYNGPDFSKGDKVYGDLHSYGYQMIKVNDNKSETKVYIENYWPQYNTCYEWLKEHNKLK